MMKKYDFQWKRVNFVIMNQTKTKEKNNPTFYRSAVGKKGNVK